MGDEQQEQPFWTPLVQVLEKAIEQAKHGEVTSIILLKAGPGIERVSDGYVVAIGGPEYDFVSLLAQAAMARVNLEEVLTEVRNERAHLSELRALLPQMQDPAVRERLQADLTELVNRGVTPLP